MPSPTFAARRTSLTPVVLALALTFALAACGDAGPGGAGGTNEPTGESAAALFTNDIAACNYFVGKGLTTFQAAGIVGNLDQESGASPTAVQGGGPGRGIAQWSVGGRWDTDANDNATAYASQHGQSVWALGLQLDFIWYELTTFSGYGLASLRGTTNVTDATVVFQNKFEGCGTCIQTQRIQYAQAVLPHCSAPPPPPPPDNPPKGTIDSAACAGVAGWAQDPDAPTTAINVDFYFNGPAGAAGTESMRLLANGHRPDLCTAIGSCDHGYTFTLPLGMQDGKAHPVHAYGIDVSGGANPELSNSPKTFTCPNAAPPLDVHKGVKRHVVDPASMTAWGFSMLFDAAPEPDAVVAAYPTGADWIEKPALVQADDGTPEVWLVDGQVRRHVVSPASLAAWHRTAAEVVKTPAAKVYAYTKGPDLPDTAFLLIGTGPAVYVLDVAPLAPPGSDAGPTLGSDGGAGGPGGPPLDGDGGSSANGDNGTGSSGGCSVQPASPGSGSAWALVLGLPLVVLARRRSRRAQ